MKNNDDNIIRAFLAIDISPQTKSYCNKIMATLSKQKIYDHMRFVHEEKLHVTLQFFDKLDLTVVPNLMLKIEEHIKNLPAITLDWTETIPFPPKHPFALALGVTLSEELETLATITNEITKELSLPERRHAYLPHLTLGRCKSRVHKLPSHLNLSYPPNQIAEHITLYQSMLTSHGSEYIPLATLTLPE